MHDTKYIRTKNTNAIITCIVETTTAPFDVKTCRPIQTKSKLLASLTKRKKNIVHVLFLAINSYIMTVDKLVNIGCAVPIINTILNPSYLDPYIAVIKPENIIINMYGTNVATKLTCSILLNKFLLPSDEKYDSATFFNTLGIK